MDSQYIKKDDSPTSVFNPLKKDFLDEIRDDNNKVKVYKVPSMQISKFPAWVAERIINDLVVAVSNERGIKPFIEEEINKIREEIRV